jgi:hypothetical protein
MSAIASEGKNSSSFIVGVGTHPLNYELSPTEFVNLLHKYNIKSIRFDYPWALVEKQKGKFKPISDKMDEMILLSAQNGIKPLIILDYGNAIYNIGKPLDEGDINRFIDYVNWTVDHFKNIDPIYEVWNEWSLGHPRTISEGSLSARQYFNLVKNVSTEIHKINPNTIVIAGSFCPTFPGQIGWARELMRLGIMNYIQGISIHPYNEWLNPMDTPEQSIDKINHMAEILQSDAHTDVSIYITEYGIPDGKNAKLDQEQIYSYAKEYYSYAKQSKYIKGVWWYDFINDGHDINNAEYNFGFLYKDLKEKPISRFFRLNIN